MDDPLIRPAMRAGYFLGGGVALGGGNLRLPWRNVWWLSFNPSEKYVTVKLGSSRATTGHRNGIHQKCLVGGFKPNWQILVKLDHETPRLGVNIKKYEQNHHRSGKKCLTVVWRQRETNTDMTFHWILIGSWWDPYIGLLQCPLSG